MKKLIARATLGFFLTLLFVSLAAAKETPNVATTPVDKKVKSWVDRFESEVANMDKGNVDLLMIGDSITHGWDGKGKIVWENYYAQRKPINLGISGDRTEHVLWRLDNLPLDKIKPKAAVIMIGTNNVGQTDPSTPKEAALGVKAIVERLEKAYPDMKQLVLYVFPRDAKPDGEKRKKVDELNSYLPELLKGKKNVTLLDINAKFLDAQGNLTDEIMKDKLHPDAYGYEIWAAAMEPTLTRLLGESNPAVEPKDKLNMKRKDDDLWWKRMHETDVAEMSKGEAQFLMVGDSITNGWDGHKGIVEKYFGEFKPLNLGIGGDQTQHVLWRLNNLPLDKIHPKVAMVMIGTNNIGSKANTPWMIAQGVKAIVEKLHKSYPKMQIAVLNVFPRGEKKDDPRRIRVEEINFCLPEALAGIKNVELVDINSIFLTEDGTLPKEIMGDFLHPGAKGYEMWAEKITPVIKAKFGK